MFSTTRAFGVFVINGKSDQIIILDKGYFIMVWRGMSEMCCSNKLILKPEKLARMANPVTGARVVKNSDIILAGFFCFKDEPEKNSGLV